MDGDKSTGGGGRKFLSKVVRFVTKPTTQWSQLDRPADLKGLIERKKRDDLVRGRELGMLRSLLPSRDGHAENATGESAGSDRASAAYTDTVARDTGAARARTLRQIEALDAQMTGRGPLARGLAPPPPPVPTKLAGPDAATAAAPGAMPVRPDTLSIQLGPEIEEVAIHFANGNFGDAESGLLRLIDSPGTRRDDVQVWLMLFDLYRATGQANKFSDLGAEFASHFERSSPQWLRRLDADGERSPHRGAAVDSERVDWRAPPWLDEPALAYVQTSFTPDATQWCVDWRGVETIDPAALPGLIDVLQRWSGTTMTLTCLGTAGLDELLAAGTPVHEQHVDPNWWLARLALLRLLDRVDAFEEAALAYCITYEVSPPAWTEPRARVILPDAQAPTELESVYAEPTAFPPTELVARPQESQGQVDENGVFRFRLEGEILGDIDQQVGTLALTPEALTIECDCHNLRRVDFGAAGALFNWVMDQQGRGRHVMFIDVNRLVTAFFGIIGISDVTAVIRAED